MFCGSGGCNRLEMQARKCHYIGCTTDNRNCMLTRTIFIGWTSIFLTPLCFGVPPCDSSNLAPEPMRKLVVEEIRWEAYWSLRPPLNPDRASVFLFKGDDYAGYCIEAWDRCALFARITGTEILGAAASRKFSLELASGQWTIARRYGVQGPGSTPGSGASRTMPAGTSTIHDPVGDETSARPATVLTVSMDACVTPAQRLDPVIPEAIVQRSQPKKLAVLLEAIKQQGLPHPGDEIVVPYFADSDGSVFVMVERRSLGPEMLVVLDKGDGWWVFRPASEATAAAISAQLPTQVLKAEMIRIRQRS